MQLEVGSIVLSKAGRDKGKYLVVVASACGYALLCDGGERPIQRPKRKSLKHIEDTQEKLSLAQMRGNSALKKALAAFDRTQREVIKHV